MTAESAILLDLRDRGRLDLGEGDFLCLEGEHGGLPLRDRLRMMRWKLALSVPL